MTKVPLQLWNRPHWELKGCPEKVQLFRSLGTAFPAATTLFVEGTSMAPELKSFFSSAAEAGPYLPARQTIWPRPTQFRLPADEPTLKGLMELAASHAEPELLDHLFVYAGTEPLLEYPDAFDPDGPLFVSSDVPEPQVRWFANELRLEISRA